MNLPNVLTLLRIPLMFIIVWLMYCSWLGAATLAVVLFIAAGITDWLDGHLARTRNQTTSFGQLMDALTDKVFVLGIMIAFVDKNYIPIVWVLLILCREFLITGMRMVAATKGVIFAAERGGKQKTVTQLIAVGLILLLRMVEVDVAYFTPFPLTAYNEVLNRIGLWVFILATCLTLHSGLNYFRKYRHVVFANPPA